MTSELSLLLQNLTGDYKNNDGSHINDFDYASEIDGITDYLILPSTFIKMISKYIDSFMSNNAMYKIVKNLRYRFGITVKFNLSKYQMTRMYLETIYKKDKTKTKELDDLFEQLKLYGNFIIDMNLKYDEIIDYIMDAINKSNYQIELQINELKQKVERIKSRSRNNLDKDNEDNIDNENDIDIENNSQLKQTYTKIFMLKNQIKKYAREVVEKIVYDKFFFSGNKIPLENQTIIINKINNYITYENLEHTDELFKSLEDYNKLNWDDAIGKKYETVVYDKIKPILEENGFEILTNIEFEFLTSYSGIKLEHDYIIGKIVDNTFIIYGIFDAKISKSLISSDIDKFAESIKMINENKLNFRYVFKKQYYQQFRKIQTIENDKILMGYFCATDIDKKKAVSKAISSYIVNHSNELFKNINGSKIELLPIVDVIKENIKILYHKFVETYEKYQTQIYIININDLII